MKKKNKFKHQTLNQNPPITAKIDRPKRWKYYYVLAIILLISFIAYLPVLHNGFVWDDEYYIQKNPLIFSINLKEIFSQYVMGNYHPFTILTLAIEYHFFGLNETGYHTINLMLHLLNIVLVWYVVFLLSNKIEIGLVAAVLFGIHPLHVESVAWASELKDLLYCFFFLASYIFYLKYLKEPQKKFYLFALLLFLFSLLSKAMAASLPLVFLLTDYFKGRKINAKTILEKAPFFALSIAFGIIAIVAQKTYGATEIIDFTLSQRIVFACYGFSAYLFKLCLPLHLSAYYPYPVKNGLDIPFQYYAYVFFFLGLVAYTFYSLRFTRKIVFGMGFFALTVFLVLQLLPVGDTIIADRYSYVPSIGIFYLGGEGFILLWNKKSKMLAFILLSSFTIFFSIKTYSRCGIWKNGMTLWSDVIRQYQTIPVAYYNRGVIFMNEKNNNQALDDYGKAIELKPDYADALINRVQILRGYGRFGEALRDYDKVIELKPADLSTTYNNRGILFMNEKRNEEALSDFNKAIELKPDLSTAYYNRGNLLVNEKKNNLGFENYSKAIELNKNYIEAYINRAKLLEDEGKIDESLNDYGKAIELKPDFPMAYFNRGNVLMNQRRYDEAISDYFTAIKLEADYATAYNNRGLAEYYLGKKDAACNDLMHAAGLGYKPAEAAILQMCK